MNAAVRLKTGFKDDVAFRTVFRDSAKKSCLKLKRHFFEVNQNTKCYHRGSILAQGATNASYAIVREVMFDLKFDVMDIVTKSQLVN